MVRNWYQPTVYHHGECCLLDENKIIVAIYIEHIDVFTAVKGTFGRRDNQCKLADKLFNASIRCRSFLDTHHLYTNDKINDYMRAMTVRQTPSRGDLNALSK